MSEYSEYFEKNKYCVIPGFFKPWDVNRMANRMAVLERYGRLERDPQCPKSLSVYSDPIHSEMQEMYRYKLETMIGKKLFATYTYARTYAPKEVLKFHSDRPSCEISLTGTLQYDTYDNKPWIIFVELDKDNPDAIESHIEVEGQTEKQVKYGRPVTLYPGDILVYKGCEIKHWRESFVGVMQSQVFIHYVDANGPYAEYKYDCRPSLGCTGNLKNMQKFNELNSRFER